MIGSFSVGNCLLQRLPHKRDTAAQGHCFRVENRETPVVRESILYKSVFVQNALPDTQNSDPRTGAVGVSERVHLGCAIHVSTG